MKKSEYKDAIRTLERKAKYKGTSHPMLPMDSFVDDAHRSLNKLHGRVSRLSAQERYDKAQSPVMIIG